MDIAALISQFGGFFWMLAAFIVALSVIVAIHEYGHYIVGRWSGIHADVFSIGMGPVLFSRVDKRGTIWQIAALPFGGYVKFAGDANAASGQDAAAMASMANDPAALRRTMHGAPLWARTATVLAGPVFNFLFSIVVFCAVLMLSGQPKEPLTVAQLHPLPDAQYTLRAGDRIFSINGKKVDNFNEALDHALTTMPQSNAPVEYEIERDGRPMTVTGPFLALARIGSIAPRSAASKAGLREGDVITKINDRPIASFLEMKQIVETSNGADLRLTLWREGSELNVHLTPKRVDEPLPDGGFQTRWRIGIINGMAFSPVTEPIGFTRAFTSSIRQVERIISGSVSGMAHMISGAISTCNLSGAVGIAQTTGEMAAQGAESFIWFIAVLSTAVGLLNLFPIPVLDGGHLMFFAYEALTGRPPNDKILQLLMTIGIAVVVSLMVFALSNDFLCP